MRAAILVTCVTALGAAVGWTAAATASEPGGATLESGVARPGGVYATVTAPDAIACAEACADDALCMSWTFMIVADGAPCELKAVIPHAVPDRRAVSGLSARAPSFARLVGARTPLGPPLDLNRAPPEAPASLPAAATPVLSDAVAAADEPPPLPGPVAGDTPILLSADTAPLPLRDRAASARP